MADANIKATVSTVIPAGTGSPIGGASQQQLRNAAGQRVLGSQLSGALASDLDTIIGQVNTLVRQAQNPQSISQILLTNAAGEVIAGFGPVTYQGVVYTNYLSEIHVGNPLGTRNPNQALFNANLDGSVTIGQHGWLDVHDFYGGNAAWIGTRNDTLAVTNAYNNGAGLIRLTVPGHNFVTGNTAEVRNMQFYGVPNAVGTWSLTVVDAKTVDLRGSVWAGAYGAPAVPPAGVDTFSPTIDRVLQVVGAISAGGLIKLQTGVVHTYLTGDKVNVPVVPGVPAATGQWIIKVVDSTHFTLNGSVFAGAFSGNGTCLRYFAGMLAQTIAIGNSFTDFNLRAFADGTLEIKNASIIVTSANGEIIIDPTGPVIEVFDAASNLVVWMGVKGGFTGFWGENVWIGGTGPADAIISATGAGVTINGATLTLTSNNTTTVINNHIGTSGFANSLVSIDVPSSVNLQINPFGIEIFDPTIFGGLSPVLLLGEISGVGGTIQVGGAAGNFVSITGSTGVVESSNGSINSTLAPQNLTVRGSTARSITLDANASPTLTISDGTPANTVTLTLSNVDSPGFSVSGTPGIDDTLTFITSVGASSGIFGTSLSVATSSTGVFGTPGAGQTNSTVVIGVVLNLGAAITGFSTPTATHTWSKGILTA